MPRTGTFDNFYFDPEVFGNYVDQQDYLKTAIIASGVMIEDPTLSGLVTKGNVGTVPFYNPVDADLDKPLNYDGKTANTPTGLEGGKQSFMVIERMKAWTDKELTRELTGANPLQHMGDRTVTYWKQVWQRKLVEAMEMAVGCTGMENHVTDLSTSSGSIAEKNKINETSALDVCQKACGDMADRFSLVIMHSVIFTAFKKMQLIDYVKYSDPRGLVPEITLPTLDGKIVVVDDRGTVDATSHPGFPIYKTFFAGRGSVLGGSKTILEPYNYAFDPEANGGVYKLYTKQSRIIHPNGFSFKFNNVVEESPTDAEWTTQENWELKFNEKNIPLAVIKTNG